MADIEPSISSGSAQLSDGSSHHEKQLCIHCKCCETVNTDVDGQPCCIFCEDGQPCPNQRGSVKAVRVLSVPPRAHPEVPAEADSADQVALRATPAPSEQETLFPRVETASEEALAPSESRPAGEVLQPAISVSTDELREMPFRQAAETWLETRRPYLAPKTFREYRLIIRTLARSFGKMRLTEITANHIRAYQRDRMASVGASAINHETSCLQQMLKRIGRWAAIIADSGFQPLRMRKSNRGRALTDEEYERLFGVTSQNVNWFAAYLFAVISVNTTAGPKEVATLRLQDVTEETIRVQAEGAKNAYRVRTIPLNEPAQKAVKAAIERAQKLGSNLPSHYVFPFREKRNHYDPTRHQTTFKTAWREMIAAADLPRLRMYDLRHHAITVLLENPDTSEKTVEAIAGHISARMKDQYAHIRIEARQLAVMGLIHKANQPKAKPQAAAPATDTIRNPDVLALIAAGLSAEIVIEKIKASACEFEMSIQVLQELRAAAVPDRVILAMLKAAAA